MKILQLIHALKYIFLFNVNLGNSSRSRPLPSKPYGGSFFVGINSINGKVSIKNIQESFNRAKSESLLK
jgi:hypothetical protein